MSEDTVQISEAGSQSELARIRTSLALDRTLLAWIRTALTFITFGFTLAKFVTQATWQHYLHGDQCVYLDSPKGLGLTMMLLGVMGLIGGAIDHWQTARKFKNTELAVTLWSASFLVAVALALLSISLMIILLIKITL